MGGGALFFKILIEHLGDAPDVLEGKLEERKQRFLEVEVEVGPREQSTEGQRRN